MSFPSRTHLGLAPGKLPLVSVTGRAQGKHADVTYSLLSFRISLNIASRNSSSIPILQVETKESHRTHPRNFNGHKA